MANTVKSYSFKRFGISVNNTPVEGFQDGDGVVAARSQDDTSMTSGNDGEVMISEMNDKSGTITFHLLYSSGFNDRFRELAKSQAFFNILVRDLVGGSKIKGTSCRIMKTPDMTIGREGGTLEWACNVGILDLEPRGLKNVTATP